MGAGGKVERGRQPVIVNGDIRDAASAREALKQSGAHGVMVGRAAMGKPWLPGEIAAALDGRKWRAPELRVQFESLEEQIADSLALYGARLGLRMVRKHVSAAIDHLAVPMTASERRALRADLCRIEDAAELVRALRSVFVERTQEELV